MSYQSSCELSKFLWTIKVPMNYQSSCELPKFLWTIRLSILISGQISLIVFHKRQKNQIKSHLFVTRAICSMKGSPTEAERSMRWYLISRNQDFVINHSQLIQRIISVTSIHSLSPDEADVFELIWWRTKVTHKNTSVEDGSPRGRGGSYRHRVSRNHMNLVFHDTHF